MRYEFAAAWLTYFEPESTCSAQRRRKSAAKIPSRATPRIATRSESRCVERYGSTTAPSAGGARRGRRAGRSVVVLAKELHLRRVVAPVERPQQAAHECVHRPGEDEVHA